MVNMAETVARLPNLAFEKTQKTKIQFLSIYGLPPLEKQAITNTIHARNGACQMWIHTHHEENGPITARNREEEIYRYRERRDLFIQKTLPNTMPIIAFIPLGTDEKNSQEQMEKYQRYYERLFTSQIDAIPKVYYVRTFENDALPCAFQSSKKQNWEYGMPVEGETIRGEWDYLSEVLREIGIKKAILSGAYYVKGGLKKDNAISGCVNAAQQALTARGFHVFISNITSPRPDI
jgi:hypothetical protein